MAEAENSQFSPRKVSFARQNVAVKHLICMVGLPARGKTYISTKLARYLNWIGIVTKVFNVGQYRRQATKEYNHHEFFAGSNKEAMKLRQEVAETALEDALSWLRETGEVVIFDATNVTLARRQLVFNKVVDENKFICLFIESVCDSEDLISCNIKDVKVNGPDYRGMDKEDAQNDFMRRIDHYQEMYVPMDEKNESHLSYIKLINAGEKIVINRHQGNLMAKIGYWLMNIHITPRTIYLTRHGESMLNVAGVIGGDPDLSERGGQYADELAKYINDLNIPDIRVWTSWYKRTIQTAAGIQAPQERWKALNEIDAGICEEMTYKEIEEKYPLDFKARERNKLTYRYPGGESYQDLISRLEAVIMELERQGNIVIVGHQAVLRCLLCYFQEKPLEDLPYVKVPLHTLMKLTFAAYGCDVELIPFDIQAVDTHRPKNVSTSNENSARKDKELIEKLSDSTAVSLNLGANDKVVHNVGSPRVYVERSEPSSEP